MPTLDTLLKTNAKRRDVYIAVGVVAIVFIALVFLSPAGKDAFAVGAVLAILGGLFQFFRDETQNTFAMGATSHMAEVAFNKHVDFCEIYFRALLQALEEMTRKGPHPSAAVSGANLSQIRRQWAIWISPELNEHLARYDTAIYNIGVEAQIIRDVPSAPGNAIANAEMFRSFAEVLGLPSYHGEHLDSEKAANNAIVRIRKTLGNEELTKLREQLMKNALESIS